MLQTVYTSSNWKDWLCIIVFEDASHLKKRFPPPFQCESYMAARAGQRVTSSIPSRLEQGKIRKVDVSSGKGSRTTSCLNGSILWRDGKMSSSLAGFYRQCPWPGQEPAALASLSCGPCALKMQTCLSSSKATSPSGPTYWRGCKDALT